MIWLDYFCPAAFAICVATLALPRLFQWCVGRRMLASERRVGVAAVYGGTYYYHWEIGACFVFRTRRRFLGVFRATEQWRLDGPPPELPHAERDAADTLAWDVEFCGVVTDEIVADAGSMNENRGRRVIVEKWLSARPR